MGSPLLFLNVGSGIGIPYAADEGECDIGQLVKGLDSLRRIHEDVLAQARSILESGRYLVGPCGWYVTYIVDTKESWGKHIAIAANTLNGFLRPSLEHLVMTANPDMVPTEPLFCFK